jgi:hypothetical protein
VLSTPGPEGSGSSQRTGTGLPPVPRGLGRASSRTRHERAGSGPESFSASPFWLATFAASTLGALVCAGSWWRSRHRATSQPGAFAAIGSSRDFEFLKASLTRLHEGTLAGAD